MVGFPADMLPAVTGDDPCAASTAEDGGAPSPPLPGPAPARDAPIVPAERLPQRWALAASLGLHAGVFLALILSALFLTPPPPPEKVLHVTLLAEGPGAAGAAGGAGGG
ncbi:MAG TPA: cell envelope integrity protein TolA, partial [Stellaceae bacterium]|nr:cell envelope integrity protein TolA [Stellaceae bacterium]